MNSVEIDDSKYKSIVVIIHQAERTFPNLLKYTHLASNIQSLLEQSIILDYVFRIIMEHTGRYHEPIACEDTAISFFVRAANPTAVPQMRNLLCAV